MKRTNYILCVDDDEDDCALLAEAFEKAKVPQTLHFEHSGDKVITFLEQARRDNNWPVLIILDINLPGINGLEILPTLREKFPIKHIPIIFLSTNASEDSLQLAESKGVSILKKPTTIQKYDGIVQTMINMIIE